MRWNVYVITYHLRPLQGGPPRPSVTDTVIAESQEAAVQGLTEEATEDQNASFTVEHIGNGPQNVLVVPPAGYIDPLARLGAKLVVAQADLEAANQRIAQLEAVLNQKPTEQPAQPAQPAPAAQNQAAGTEAAAIPDPEKPTIN